MTKDEIKEEMEKLAALHSKGVNYNNYRDVLDKAFRMMYQMWKAISDNTESIEQVKDAKPHVSVEVK
jgi:lantibiotic modifying enzyme